MLVVLVLVGCLNSLRVNDALASSGVCEVSGSVRVVSVRARFAVVYILLAVALCTETLCLCQYYSTCNYGMLLNVELYQICDVCVFRLIQLFICPHVSACRSRAFACSSCRPFCGRT